MDRSRLRIWRLPRLVSAAVGPLALLLSLTVVGAGTAAAAPAAGYTASSIPTGQFQTLVAVNSATNTVYLGALNLSDLVVVDGSTNAVTTTIALPGDVRGIAVDQVTDTIYASVLSIPPAVAVIDGTTNKMTTTIPLAANSFPIGVGVDSSTDTVYVAEQNAAAVAVINGSTNLVTTTVSTGSGTLPWQVAVDETSHDVWVADENSGVETISGTSNTVTQRFTLGGASPEAIAVNQVTDTVYAGTQSDGIAVINDTAGTVSYITTSLAVPAIAVDPGSGTVFASSTVGIGGSGTTWVIDDASNNIVDTIPRGGTEIAVNTANGKAYVAAATTLVSSAWVLTPSAANAWSPVIKSTSARFTAGTTGSFGITGTALPAATYSESGALPSGVTLSSSGVLSGKPAAGTGGSYAITLTASNGVSPNYSQPFTLVVDEAPAITSANQATFDTGAAGSFTMTATGFPAPFFSATGTLPLGVTLQADGVLSGTPAADTGGSYPIQVTAQNFVGTATQAFTLAVDQAPAITSAALVTFHVDVAGSLKATATGFPSPTFSETGALPPGITFNSAGLFSGTPTTVGRFPIQVTATNSTGSATQAVTLSVDRGSSFVPVGPVRVLDTRNGVGHTGPVGPGQAISLQVTGTNGVPASGVTAVVLNVTAVGPTASSYVTVYPDGTTRPNASNLNFTAGRTIANLVTVPVGANGKVDFYNNTGSVSLLADLAGYDTTSSTAGSSFVPAGPVRLLDTRNNIGHSGAVGQNVAIGLQVTGVHGIPSSGVTAVVLNVTAIDPTASSYITVYPDGTARPVASNLNFTAGETIPNLVVVPVGADGKIDFYNHAGSVNLAADLAGYYTTSSITGSSFVPAGPLRVLDTRNGVGHSGAVGANSAISLQVTGSNGIPAGATAVVLNVTAVSPTAASYVTVYADGTTRPVASNLNFTAGETIPNLVVVPVGPDGKIDFYNHTGSVNLIADLAGYYTNP